MNGRRIKNKIACLLLVFLLGQAIFTPAFSFGNPIIDAAQNIYGAIRYDVTIAELIISLLTGAGATPVNSAMAQALESNLGSAAYTVGAMAEEGLFNVVDGVFIDNGFVDAIENTAVWAEYGLNEIFSTGAGDLALGGGAAVAAGGAANLGAVVAEAASSGAIMSFTATAGVAALAIGGGVAVGVLIDHIITHWGNFMSNGLPLNEDEAIVNFINGGSGYAITKSFPNSKTGNWSENVYKFGSGLVCVQITDYSNTYRLINAGSKSVKVSQKGRNNNTQNGNTTYGEWTNYAGYSIPSRSYGSVSNLLQASAGTNEVTADYSCTEAQWNSIYNNILNGNLYDVSPISPDVIGKAGNMPHINGQDQNGDNQVTFPDIVSPLQEGEGLKPIQWDDYMDFVQDANDLYDNNPSNQEDQIQNWNDFKDPYIDEINETPDNPSNPDNPVDPDPDANYVPDFTDDITPDTVIDDVVLDDVIDDVVPDQPDIPDKPDLTPEEIDENLDVSVSGDITDIFPFCIPFDVIALFEKIGNVDRKAPKFHWILDLGQFGEYEIDVDLTEWENVATLCRTLETIVFILGLIIITRYLIGG